MSHDISYTDVRNERPH